MGDDKPSLLETLKRDAARYAPLGGWFSNLGFWIGTTHRVNVWARSLPAPVSIPVVTQCRLLKLVWRFGFNVRIHGSARIAPGLCLIHPTNILIPDTEVGENLLVFNDVTIGSNLGSNGLPRIGNDVDIYIGARLLGDIQVGDGAKIGANCVVTTSVPPGSVVATAANRVAPAPGARRAREAK